ncbi:DUF4232 domain-containing protein [Streptomyces sp. RG80]|uniref:DUF4232 domain-containing protein n=1 Tax=Streptomyces sp. RG80 TaxID=3157340 RepID=UPI00338DC1D7
MSTRTRRTRRLLAAAALTAAALTLTACGSDGSGVQDEGASAGSSATPSASPSGKASGGTSGGSGQADQASGSKASGGANGATPPSGSGGSKGSTGSSGSSGSSGSKDGRVSAICSSVSSRMVATEVSRPLNHLLLTVTNTGAENCKLMGYPAVQFEGAQSVPPTFGDSKPQAVITLAPGESGYASVLLSAADGSGSNGYTAKSLAVGLDSDPNGAAHPSLPSKGVYLDDSIRVSYWQSTMADALTW